MLSYPLEMNQALTDFVSFSPEEYRANSAGGGGGGAAPPPSGSSQIVLYMPNSTPEVANTNSWENVDFVY